MTSMAWSWPLGPLPGRRLGLPLVRTKISCARWAETLGSIRSCGSAGNCGAGGSYLDGAGRTQVFVVNAVNGTWHAAIEVPGTASLNKGFHAQVNSVSCGAAGNCSAGGFYSDISHDLQAFVVSES